MSCHRLLHSITDTRTVANGTDTNTKIDRARRPRTSVPISPNRRGCSWWWAHRPGTTGWGRCLRCCVVVPWSAGET